MRAQVLPCFCVVCLLVAGCALLPDQTGAGFALTNREDAIASAMAHYAVGKIYEHDLGEHSYSTLRHLTKTGELDKNAYNRAVRKAEKICKANPDSYSGRIELARIQHLAGFVTQAIANFEQAMRLEPSNPITYVDLASLLFFEKRDEEAVSILTKGIEVSDKPRIPMDFAYRKGREFLSTDEIPRAAACFIIVANVSKGKGSHLHHMLGELYEKLGYADQAAESYGLAIQDDIPMPNSYLRLAAIQLKSDHEKAMETLLQASSRLPDEPAIHMALGYLYSTRQNTEKAAESFEKTIILSETKTPTINLSPGFFLDVAAVFELLNHFDKADKVYTHCVKKFPNNHGVLNYVAYSWAERSVYLEDAENYSRKSIELQPENGAYLDTLGWIFYQQKKYDEALKAIKRANEMMKSDPTIVEHLGDVFSAMGNEDKALSLWKQSYKIDTSNPAIREKLEEHGVNVDKIPKETSE